MWGGVRACVQHVLPPLTPTLAPLPPPTRLLSTLQLKQVLRGSSKVKSLLLQPVVMDTKVLAVMMAINKRAESGGHDMFFEDYYTESDCSTMQLFAHEVGGAGGGRGGCMYVCGGGVVGAGCVYVRVWGGQGAGGVCVCTCVGGRGQTGGRGACLCVWRGEGGGGEGVRISVVCVCVVVCVWGGGLMGKPK